MHWRQSVTEIHSDHSGRSGWHFLLVAAVAAAVVVGGDVDVDEMVSLVDSLGKDKEFAPARLRMKKKTKREGGWQRQRPLPL